MTTRHIAALVMTALVSLPALTGCGKYDRNKPSATNGMAVVACDQSFENILSQEIDVYEYVYPDANIMAYYVDENAAFDSLFNLSARMVIASRTLSDKEISYLKSQRRVVRQHRIAVDAIALIVNPANNVEQLSISELADILSGKETDWNDVWPNNLGKIEVVFDHQGSSTVKYMRDSILHGGRLGENVFAQQSSQDVFKAVAANKNAIGILGVSWISADMNTKALTSEEKYAALEGTDTIAPDFATEVKVLKISRDDQVEGYAPYQYYIYSGDYPLTRSVYAISTASGGTLTHGFYSFLTGFQGQKLIQMTGVLPDIMYTRRVELTE